MQRGDSSRPAVARQAEDGHVTAYASLRLAPRPVRTSSSSVLPGGGRCRSVTLTPPAGPRHIAAPRTRTSAELPGWQPGTKICMARTDAL
jgi:hypothetical protein